MTEQEKNNTPVDETVLVETEELRKVLQEKEEKNQKKESWIKRLFKKKNKDKK